MDAVLLLANSPHLKRWAAGLSNAGNVVRLQLDDCTLDTTADRAVVQGTGIALCIKNPSAHSATRALLCCQALHPAHCKGPGGERLQDSHLKRWHIHIAYS